MATIFDLILQDTLADAHAWALPNVKGQGQERWIGTRRPTALESFCRKRDIAGFGVFFCVSTIAIGQPRKKEHARELRFLFCDIDFKDHDTAPAEIERLLRALPCPPTRMHHTGNGIHCFWLMETPFLSDGMAEAEVLLRKLCNLLGGDPTVAHCVALMRVPGTHNTKRGQSLPVTVIREGVETYAPAQIDAWVGSAGAPLLVRRNAPALNAFERMAQEQAFRAPIDVDARLQAMSVGGEGDAGVHNTLLSCTASMVAAGIEEDDIVQELMGALDGMEGTEGWNWVQEEREIRGMCRDAHVKFVQPKSIRSALEPLVKRTGGGEPPAPPSTTLPDGVVSLSDARKERDAESDARRERVKDKLSKKKKNEHVVLGMGILAGLDEENRRIMYADNQCWMYEGGVWKSIAPDDERLWISVMVERGCNAIGLVSTTKIVNETRAWLQRQPDLYKGTGKVEWDAHGMIATKSGLIGWEADDTRHHDLLPSHYVTRIIDCEYAPAAECNTWEDMLYDDYGFDDGTVDFLQEFAGCCLVNRKPRTLMRALVLLGPSNTGKSNILNVIAGLISMVHNSTALKTLENSHGLMDFLKPIPWVLHEAFEQSKWEMSATVKALLSGDAVHVNIKNGPMHSLEFKQPILWGTNVPPQFREASRAMENRLAIVKMTRSYNPAQVVGTALQAQEAGYRTPAELVLATEKAGLLNWAIEGLKRAWTRGHFVFTNEMQASLHAMRTDSNMATGFVEECCTYDPTTFVVAGDFYGAFAVWHRDHRGGQTPSNDSIGRSMTSLADPRVLAGERVNKKRIYAGLRLNEEGLDCWNAYSSSVMQERSGVRISERDTEVNKLLTAEQLQRGVFVAMQAAHASWQPDPT